MPKPKTVKVDCDTCGLDWRLHKPNAKDVVPLTECVRLLKAELVTRPRQAMVWNGNSISGAASPHWPFYFSTSGGAAN